MEREKPFIAEEFLEEVRQFRKTFLEEIALGGENEDSKTQQLTFDALESQAEHLVNTLKKNLNNLPTHLLKQILSEVEALKKMRASRQKEKNN